MCSHASEKHNAFAVTSINLATTVPLQGHNLVSFRLFGWFYFRILGKILLSCSWANSYSYDIPSLLFGA